MWLAALSTCGTFQSIRACVPSSKSQRGATVETHLSPRCGCHDPSYHKTHTFTNSGKVASKLDWTKQPSFHWNARSSPFFPFLKKTSLQATHFCHFSSVPTKERWANQLCRYIFIPRIFFLRSSNRFSHPILFPFSLRLVTDEHYHDVGFDNIKRFRDEFISTSPTASIIHHRSQVICRDKNEIDINGDDYDGGFCYCGCQHGVGNVSDDCG